MTSVPGSEHRVPPMGAYNSREKEITLSVYDPQHKENMYDIMRKASYLLPNTTNAWKRIEPTETSLKILLKVPGTTNVSKLEEELAVWAAKPSNQLNMWGNTENERLRLVCLEDAARTVIESGDMKTQGCIRWLGHERRRAGSGWDPGHRAQFDYLPEGQSEGVSTEMIAPTIGPISEYKKWKEARIKAFEQPSMQGNPPPS